MMKMLSCLSLAILVASGNTNNYPMVHCNFLAHYMGYVSVVGKYLFTKEMSKGVDMSKLTDEQWYDMKNASYEVARDELCNTYQFARYYFTQNVGGYSPTAVLVS